MTKILIDEAVARQALAALEAAVSDAADFERINFDDCEKAIAALRQALEQPAPAQPLTFEESEEAYGKAGVIHDHVPADDAQRIANAAIDAFCAKNGITKREPK